MTALTIIQDQALTMTSQEIADLVEKRHDNVKRTIESLANQGVIESPQIEEIPTATRPASVYVFSGERGKRDSIIVVAQLSPEFTARLVDRWQELEKAHAVPTINLNDPAFLREALLGYTEKVIALQTKVQEVEAVVEKQAPKVEVFDRLSVETEGAMPIRRAAALLQYPERKLAQLMDHRRWIYKLPGSDHWCVHAEARRMGYMETKLHTGLKEDGGTWRREQVLVTPRGLTRLAYYLNQEQAA